MHTYESIRSKEQFKRQRQKEEEAITHAFLMELKKQHEAEKIIIEQNLIDQLKKIRAKNGLV